MSDPVLSLLQSKNISFTLSGKDYLIKCLNPDHEDTNPSCRVDKVSGLTHCFACGFKRNLFKHFGVFTNNTSLKTAKLKEKIKDLRISTSDLELPEGATPYTRPFRGVSTQTLKHFGAFYTSNIQELEDRICFPITEVSGKMQVFVCRHVLSQGNPRYVNYPRHRTMPCFPVIMPDGAKSAVLVEGIFDMLNLYDKGLKNVVCTFGTQTLVNSANTKLLALKAQGIEKLYIMFDGDKAGRDAAKELKPIIEEVGFIVEIIDLPDDTDPGIMSKEDIESIKEYISGTSSNN